MARITIEVEAESAEEFLNQLVKLSTRKPGPVSAFVPDAESSRGYIGEGAVTTFTGGVIAEPEPKEDVATGPEEGKLPSAVSIVEKLDSQYKRGQSGVGKDKAIIREGDEVADAEGQIGIVVALYRGRAVIEYDDKSGAEVGTSTLTLIPQEDEPDAEPEETSAADAMLDDEDEGEDVVEITHELVRALAKEAVGKIGGEKVLAMLTKMTGVEKVKLIPDDKLPGFFRALKAEVLAAGKVVD